MVKFGSKDGGLGCSEDHVATSLNSFSATCGSQGHRTALQSRPRSHPYQSLSSAASCVDPCAPQDLLSWAQVALSHLACFFLCPGSKLRMALALLRSFSLCLRPSSPQCSVRPCAHPTHTMDSCFPMPLHMPVPKSLPGMPQ